MSLPFCTHLRGMLSIIAITTAAVILAGCFGESRSWHSKDISNLMPELAFELTGTSGDTVSARDTSGKIRMLFFGFTSCPDVCPATLTKLSRAVKGMPDQWQDDTQIVFVSVDPERDTPETIKNYVNFFSDKAIGLTGKKEALRALTKRYRTTFGYEDPDAEGNYNVSHSGAVYVFDREGNARLLFKPDLSVEDIREDLIALAHEGEA